MPLFFDHQVISHYAVGFVDLTSRYHMCPRISTIISELKNAKKLQEYLHDS